MVGPYYENVELGLDAKGQGKYRNKFAVAGLAFLIMPIAMNVNEEVRFVRIGEAEPHDP